MGATFRTAPATPSISKQDDQKATQILEIAKLIGEGEPKEARQKLEAAVETYIENAGDKNSKQERKQYMANLNRQYIRYLLRQRTLLFMEESNQGIITGIRLGNHGECAAERRLHRPLSEDEKEFHRFDRNGADSRRV